MKEAMAMRSSGHLLRRAGRKLPRGTIWVLVAYAALAAILTLVVGLPLPWGLLGAGGLLALVWVNTDPDNRHSGSAGAGAVDDACRRAFGEAIPPTPLFDAEDAAVAVHRSLHVTDDDSDVKDLDAADCHACVFAGTG